MFLAIDENEQFSHCALLLHVLHDWLLLWPPLIYEYDFTAMAHCCDIIFMIFSWFFNHCIHNTVSDLSDPVGTGLLPKKVAYAWLYLQILWLAANEITVNVNLQMSMSLFNTIPIASSVSCLPVSDCSQLYVVSPRLSIIIRDHYNIIEDWFF